MNMFARFDENPAMTLWVIKETKRYGRTLTFLSKVFVLHIWTCLQGLVKIQQWLFELLRKQSVTDGRTHGRTHGRTDNVKTVYPLQTKFAGGINITIKIWLIVFKWISSWSTLFFSNKYLPNLYYFSFHCLSHTSSIYRMDLIEFFYTFVEEIMPRG